MRAGAGAGVAPAPNRHDSGDWAAESHAQLVAFEREGVLFAGRQSQRPFPAHEEQTVRTVPD